jgi:hypothetical protein
MNTYTKTLGVGSCSAGLQADIFAPFADRVDKGVAAARHTAPAYARACGSKVRNGVGFM